MYFGAYGASAPSSSAACQAKRGFHIMPRARTTKSTLPEAMKSVPRFLFSDFPLGNSAGRPHDEESQAFTLELALRLLESAPATRTTVHSPLRWSDNADWKLDYSNPERLSAEEIVRLRAEFDRGKETARAIRGNQLIA